MGDRLKGKVALVTGSGRGIGRTVVMLLAAEGASVVVNDLGGNVDGTGASQEPASQVAAEIKQKGGIAVANFDSVAEFDGAKRMVQTALDSFGKLDILIHVAGILRDRMFFNMTEEEWDGVLAVHLKGAFNTVRNAVPHMIRQKWGRVLIFSSGSGLGNSGQINYSSAKEGQVGFVRALAMELAPYNITVNAIYPGGATRMTATVPTAAAQIRADRGIVGGGGARPGAAAGPPEESRDPANNAAKAVYLCTDDASDITGQVVGTSGWQMSLYSPRHATRAIHKDGRWSLDELDSLLPISVTSDLVNPAPPAQQPAR